MKICKICANNEILCKVCSDKLNRGEIAKIDVDVSRAIEKIKRDFDLKDVDFEFCFNGEQSILIVTKKMGGLIGPGGKNVKKLAEYLGKPVRIIKSPNTPKELIENLIGISPLIGINVLFKNGEERYKVRLKNEFKKKLSMQVREFTEIFKHLTGKNIELVFE